MLPNINAFELVDLLTTDRDLEEIMLCDYPHPLLPENIIKDYSDPEVHIFNFKSLNKTELLKFIKPYQTIYEFEIREAYTGNFVVINRLDPQLN